MKPTPKWIGLVMAIGFGIASATMAGALWAALIDREPDAAFDQARASFAASLVMALVVLGERRWRQKSRTWDTIVRRLKRLFRIRR